MVYLTATITIKEILEANDVEYNVCICKVAKVEIDL